MSSAMPAAVARALSVKLPATRPTHHLLGDDAGAYPGALSMSHYAAMAAMRSARPQPRINLGVRPPPARPYAPAPAQASPVAPSVALRRAWLQQDDACSLDHSQDVSMALSDSIDPQSPAPEIIDMLVDVAVSFKAKEARALDDAGTADVIRCDDSPAAVPAAPAREGEEEQRMNSPSPQPSASDAAPPQQTEPAAPPQQSEPAAPDSLFMRLFAEHGGVRAVDKPPPYTSELRNRTRDPCDGCTLDTWQSACHRAQTHAASGAHRSVLRAADRFPPTGADPQDDDGFGPTVWRPTAHILSEPAAAPIVAPSKRGRFLELPKSYQPRISLTPHGLSRLSGAKGATAQVPSGPTALAWKKAAPQCGAMSARVASVFERLQSHSQSPRALKTPRTYDPTCTLLRTNSQPELPSQSWGSKACGMCGVAEPAIGSQCCDICEQLKHFAKRGGFRTVDLRSAVRSGHIDSSHLLSEECFAQVMKAYVRGDTGASERKTLQAGARAERMHKRNRV